MQQAAEVAHFLQCSTDTELEDPFAWLQKDNDLRLDGRMRTADYDSHLGIVRDPVTREIVSELSMASACHAPCGPH